MPSGPPSSRLAASALRTSATACSSWPTPATRDGKGGYLGGRMRDEGDTLDVAAQLAAWPTPDASVFGNISDTTLGTAPRRDEGQIHGNGNGIRPDNRRRRRSWRAWPTPNTPSGGRSTSNREDGRATGRTIDGRKHTASLEHAVKFAGWPTPRANENVQTNLDEIAETGSSLAGAAPGSDGGDNGPPLRPRPPDSFWSTASFWSICDWIFCRDGKWRPIEPIHVEMAPRSTASVGRMCPEEGRRVNASVPDMQPGAGAADVPFGEAGDAVGVPEESLLLDTVRKESSGKGEMHRASSEPDKGSSLHKSPMRELRENGSPSRSSQGRGSVQQSPIEFDDLVRLLPSSRALASLHGRSEDAKALLILQQAIESEAGLHGSSGTLAEAWASLGEDEKRQIRERMGFDAARWRLVVPFPLIDGSAFKLGSGGPFEGKSRAGMLRGYGNAICLPVARAFIEAVLGE